MEVGSTVRAKRKVNGKEVWSRAIVATEQDSSLHLIWEDLAPQPLSGSSGFLVTPLFDQGQTDDRESTVSKEDVSTLLDFEVDNEEISGQTSTGIDVWKECGDSLLGLGDPSTAAPYFEKVLEETSKISVGATVIVRQNGSLLAAATIDCLEDTTADIAFCDENETEAVLPLTDVLLSVSLTHCDVQIKTLLNLTRCLLQLAVVDMDDLHRPSGYRKAAVGCCSMVLLILDQEEDDDIGNDKLYDTALLLRSRAQAGCMRLKEAVADANRLLKRNPSHNEGRHWRVELQKLAKQQDKANKKLVKGMSKWINKAMKESEQGGNNSVSAKGDDRTLLNKKDEASSSHPEYSWFRPWMPFCFILFFTLWMQKWLQDR